MKEKKTRPCAWKSGPDPELHRRYLQWLQQRNQAQWRGEEWDLSFEAWLQVWGDDIHLRGRKRGQLSLIRRNYLEPWHQDNVVKVTREEQSAIQAMIKMDKKRRLEPEGK